MEIDIQHREKRAWPWVFEVANVQRAAESLVADRPLLEQGGAVQGFFARSATAVRRMSRGGT